MTYGVTVSNLGPDDVSGVVVSNMLPAGVGLVSVSPANLAFSFTNNDLVFNLGNLPAFAATNVLLQVQPTNAGQLAFSVTVSAFGNADPNPANNQVTNSVTVSNFPPSTLVAANASAMTFNPQTGLMEQTVNLAQQWLPPPCLPLRA